VTIAAKGLADSRRLAAGILLAAAMGCSRFDESQVPQVTVGKGLRPEIAWTPPSVYQLQVFEGADDKGGIGALWTLSGEGGYENRLLSPVIYGVPPPGSQFVSAPPLTAGRTYTVVVTRADEKGGGDGFLNTRQRYAGVRTFVAEEPEAERER
jgi:hypothetical protein